MNLSFTVYIGQSGVTTIDEIKDANDNLIDFAALGFVDVGFTMINHVGMATTASSSDNDDSVTFEVGKVHLKLGQKCLLAGLYHSRLIGYKLDSNGETLIENIRVEVKN